MNHGEACLYTRIYCCSNRLDADVVAWRKIQWTVAQHAYTVHQFMSIMVMQVAAVAAVYCAVLEQRLNRGKCR
jgi:hypothetical protein